MRQRGIRPALRPGVALVMLLVALATALVAAAPPAAAHAELRQASPRVDSVVGGEFHSIALQFSGLDTEANFRAELLDPAGQPIGGAAAREEQRIVIPIEPLEAPGLYTVTYTTIGVDGDLVSDQYSFRYDPAAPEPEAITIEITTAERVGWVGYLLLLAGAAVLGYLAHRVRWAWKQHRAYGATSGGPETGAEATNEDASDVDATDSPTVGA